MCSTSEDRTNCTAWDFDGDSSDTMLRTSKSTKGQLNGTPSTNHHGDMTDTLHTTNHYNNRTSSSPELTNDGGREVEEEEEESIDIPLGIDDTMFVSRPQQRFSVISTGGNVVEGEVRSKRDSTISAESSTGVMVSGVVCITWEGCVLFN